MKNSQDKDITSFREIGDRMGIGSSTVWDIMDKIRFKFERNKAFIYYMDEKTFDLEKLLLELR